MNEITNNFTNRFQRSIRIDTDFNDLGIVDTFVSSETSDKTIEKMCEQIKNGQQAFTWTGSYGSGKSSLALILHGSLSHKNNQLYKQSINLIGKKAREAIENTFQNFSQRIVLPIVAGKSNLEDLININLDKHDILSDKKVNLIERLEVLSDSQQVIIFVDELGKYLEYASSVNQDIMFLQNLAELCNRSKGKIIFVGILHQSFSEYSKTSDQSVKDEWKKIQGRFIDIPINVSSEEQINLMSQSLSYDEGTWSSVDKKKHIENFKINLKDKYGWVSLKSLDNLYPLNPITAFLISAISKRAFAQNQRTIFGFLNSVEPHGFKTVYFAEYEKLSFNYSPRHLWDYLYANLDVSISNSPDAHSWITSVDIIEQASSLVDKSGLDILKCISLIQTFGSRTLIQTTKENIYAAFPFETSKQIDDKLNFLLNKKFLLYREISKTFHITETSDFDLDLALKPYIENDEDLNDELLSTIIDLKPIIGKRHYIDTGNFRFLKIVVKTFDNLSKYIETLNFDNNGELIICLPSKNEMKSEVKTDIEKSLRNIDTPLALALPKQANKIIKLFKKLSALELVQKNNEVIKIDKIARKEVATFIDLGKKEIEFLVQNLFFHSEWFVTSYKKNYLKKWQDLDINKPQTLNSEVSNLFDEFFPSAPVIKNELTNKTKVSGNANQAIKVFLKKLISETNKEKLGIEKTPPELTIYKAYIEDQSLHKKIKPSIYELQLPGSKALEFKNMWTDAVKIMTEETDYVNAETLFDIWSKPPYGIKRGAFPIILMLFILTNKDKLAVYHENIFVTEFDDYFVECLMKLTKEFSFTVIDFDQVGENLEQYYKIIKKFNKENINPNRQELTLNIGKALKKIYKSQPDFIKTTKKFKSSQTVDLRDEIGKANDPIDLVLKVLPKIFGEDYKAFEKSLLELQVTYDNFLLEFNRKILKFFKYSSSANDLKELNERALAILKKSGDFSLDPFILQMQTFDNSKHSAERVLLNLLKKNPNNMNDNDMERLQILLSQSVDQFFKVETHAKISKRKYKSTSVSVLYGGYGNKEVHDFNFNLNAKEKRKAKKIAGNIEKAIFETINKNNQTDMFDVNEKIVLGAISEYLSNNIKLIKDG